MVKRNSKSGNQFRSYGFLYPKFYAFWLILRGLFQGFPLRKKQVSSILLRLSNMLFQISGSKRTPKIFQFFQNFGFRISNFRKSLPGVHATSQGLPCVPISSFQLHQQSHNDFLFIFYIFWANFKIIFENFFSKFQMYFLMASSNLASDFSKTYRKAVKS